MFCNASSWETSNYGAEVAIPNAIRASRYVTSDPAEADFFLVPAPLYCLQTEQSLKHHRSVFPEGTPDYYWYSHATEAVQAWVQAEQPFWNKSGGADHLWIYSQDHGKDIVVANTAFDWVPIGIPTHAADVNLTKIRERSRHRKPPQRSGTGRAFDRLALLLGRKQRALHFAPLVDQMSSQPTSVWGTKTSILYFAGDLRFEDAAYSHGVRQMAFRMGFNATKGFRLLDSRNPEEALGSEEYLEGFGQSLFCLAATGAGWGVRLKLAMMYRCIPVIISDDVQMELEDVLDFTNFAVRLPQHAMYALPEVLNSIIETRNKVKSMQLVIDCAWRFFTWKPPYGRALEALMCSLRRKLDPEIKPRLDHETCTLICGE
ncbi:hypothetical protein WJX72_009832 [[Myrmecia] bisecta]|uniref:Exostosin GT47 domain-containing protein n=1 Tax=[Myrmecia] bisecta TaxID=41462 RepID=A0AAW1R965_9CHLO